MFCLFCFFGMLRLQKLRVCFLNRESKLKSTFFGLNKLFNMVFLYFSFIIHRLKSETNFFKLPLLLTCWMNIFLRVLFQSIHQKVIVSVISHHFSLILSFFTVYLVVIDIRLNILSFYFSYRCDFLSSSCYLRSNVFDQFRLLIYLRWLCFYIWLLSLISLKQISSWLIFQTFPWSFSFLFI